MMSLNFAALFRIQFKSDILSICSFRPVEGKSFLRIEDATFDPVSRRNTTVLLLLYLIVTPLGCPLLGFDQLPDAPG